ncbi:lysoplasmalogenase [Streptomyces sp. NPDC049555]|uniref:lysoplasmalogenase n=1 Tax=Streptomyces sp. NPDC049555 TaxID=3154930 RepID=UPI00343EFF01
MKAAARAVPAAFGAVAAAHLGALLAHATALAHLTKPALMPLLAAAVLLHGGSRLLAAALLCGCAGDVLLQADGRTPFLVGMAAFAAGHLCYLALFARHGTSSGSRTYRLAVAYAAAWLATVALLWPGLEAGMRLPVVLYSLLLTAMALAATRAGVWAAAGGLLFLVSDSLLAGGLAGWPQAPAAQFWVMLTYAAAQALLAYGVHRCVAAAGAGSGRPAPARAAVSP